MLFMLPLQWTSHQAMAGDRVVQSSQEGISTSESDNVSTVGLEQTGVENISGIEQLKMSICICDVLDYC